MWRFQRSANLSVFTACIVLISGEAFAETFFLVDDLGVQGKYRRCKYSNGKVYGLPAVEPACYDSIESSPSPAQQGNSTALPAAGVRTFRNCSEARAAGAAPVRIGDPGYSIKLDRDGDGIGCE